MSGVRRRLGAYLLASADGAVAPAAAPRGLAAAVLGPADAVVPVAGAVAGELRARAGVPAAVVCVWGPAAGADGPVPARAALPAARRLAAGAGAPAVAAGRLAWVALDGAPADARVQAERLVGDTPVPVVLAVAGPRPAELDALLATAAAGVVVVEARAGDALVRLARAALPGIPVQVVRPLPAGPSRWGALAGLARLRGLDERTAASGDGADAIGGERWAASRPSTS